MFEIDREKDRKADFEEFKLLLGRYLNHSIDDEQAGRMLELVDRYPAWKKIVVGQLRLDSLLSDFEKGAGRPPTTIDLLADLQFGRSVPQEPEKIEPAVRVGKTKTKTFYRFRSRTDSVLYFLATSIFLLLIAAGIGDIGRNLRIKPDFFHVHETSMTVRVENLDGVVWSPEQRPLHIGERIERGKVALDEGKAVFSVSGMFEMTVEGPAEIAFSSQKRIFCWQGNFDIRVSSKGRDLEVFTPFAKVVDHGTEFSVIVDDDSAEVHVTSGLIGIGRDRREHRVIAANTAIRALRAGFLEDVPFRQKLLPPR